MDIIKARVHMGKLIFWQGIWMVNLILQLKVFFVTTQHKIYRRLVSAFNLLRHMTDLPTVWNR